MFSDHLRARAKLFSPRLAKEALAARDEVMQADAIASLESSDIRARSFDDASDLMSERDRQRFDRRNARAVMRIGMTNPGGLDADQDIECANGWELKLFLLKWRTD
jgi:hypothetical protein